MRAAIFPTVNMNAMGNDVQVFSTSDQERNVLYEILGTIVDSRWLIAGIIFIFSSGGLFYAFIAQPVYRSDALLQVAQEATGIGALGDFADLSNLFQAAAVETEMEILKSRTVLERVVDNIDLDINAEPHYFPVVGAAIARRSAGADKAINSWLPRLKNPWFDLKKYAWGDERIEVERFEVPDRAIGEVFTVVADQAGRYRLFNPAGNLLTEGMVGEATESCRMAGEPCMLLISKLEGRPGTEFTLSRRLPLDAVQGLQESLAIEALGWDDKLDNPAGLIKVSLEGTDRERTTAIVNEIVEIYLQQNAARKSAEGERTLELLQEQLPIVKADMERAEAALIHYRTEQGSFDIPRQTRGLLDQIVPVEAELAELTEQRRKLLGRFTPLFTARRDHVAALGVQIATLEAEKKALEEQIERLPNTQQGILRLRRDPEVNRQLYTTLLNKVQQLKVANAGTPGSVQVIDGAVIPQEPVGLDQALAFAMFPLTGMVIGIGTALFRRSLLEVVEDPDVIESRLGLPVYAVVPHSAKQSRIAKGAYRWGKKDSVLSARDGKDVAVESLRGLRTWLNFAFLGAKNNVLLITGPSPGVGKSFVSVNLATVLANGGKRTVLVDADLRKGHLHQYFKMKPKQGLSDVIAGDVNIDQVVLETDVEKLFLLPTGALPPNPSELLLHERFVSIMDKLSSDFDLVIIDSPPVLAVTDSAILGHVAGSALLVVKANKHHLREIEQSAKRLRQVDVNLRGVVFNDMMSNKFYGYGKYYGHAYSSYK